jgi:hypothetical protein
MYAWCQYTSGTMQGVCITYGRRRAGVSVTYPTTQSCSFPPSLFLVSTSDVALGDRRGCTYLDRECVAKENSSINGHRSTIGVVRSGMYKYLPKTPSVNHIKFPGSSDGPHFLHLLLYTTVQICWLLLSCLFSRYCTPPAPPQSHLPK